MTNRKFNIIFIIISLCLLLIISVMSYMLIRNEASRNYFDLKEIENYEWINNTVKFTYIDNKVTLIINDDKMYDEKEVILNRQTGEIIKDKLYVRSITKNNLVIWYEKEEYRLNKKIIAR